MKLLSEVGDLALLFVFDMEKPFDLRELFVFSTSFQNQILGIQADCQVDNLRRFVGIVLAVLEGKAELDFFV